MVHPAAQVRLGLAARYDEASRSEAVAMLGKRRVPLPLKNLQQGLLDQSVDDARHAELSDPTVRLGDFDPLDRLRLVGSLEQLRPNAWPVPPWQTLPDPGPRGLASGYGLRPHHARRAALHLPL